MHRTLIALLLAALGLLRLVVPADAAGSLTVQAESFTLPAGSGMTFTEGSTTGLLIWSNATATRQVTTPAFTKLTIRARGDQCAGSPKMRVSIDGTAVWTKTVVDSVWTSSSALISRPAGAHTIGIAFINDYMAPGCDRNLRIDHVTFVDNTPAATPTPTPTPAQTQMYVDPNSNAKHQADAWRTSRPSDGALIDKIANQPQGFWFGEWSGDVRAAVNNVVTAAGGKVPVLVAYNIPDRDCGGYSAGGTTYDAYRSWIRSFASGIGARKAIVVLEPDALAAMTCLNEAGQSTRLSLLRDAVSVLKTQSAASVYIDAGHSRWLAATDAANRLNQAGIAQADGFSLNVSNFGTTSGELSYGNQVSAGVGGKHFVVDTSRNGLGPDAQGQWCNPSGRALGNKPTLQTGQVLADGYLWVKRPGESDGTCNGGPAAGAWWADYALGLAQRASW